MAIPTFTRSLQHISFDGANLLHEEGPALSTDRLGAVLSQREPKRQARCVQPDGIRVPTAPKRIHDFRNLTECIEHGDNRGSAAVHAHPERRIMYSSPQAERVVLVVD